MARKYYPKPGTPIGSSGSVEYESRLPVGRVVCVVKIGSPEWDQWITVNKAFAYMVGDLFYSVKSFDRRRGNGYWSAYKGMNNQIVKIYIGTSDKLTVQRLEEIGRDFKRMIDSKQIQFRNDGLVKRPKRIKED